MQQLFKIILKYHFFFLFVLLEVVSVYLVVQKGYQRSAYLNSTNALNASMQKGFNSISQYLGLKNVNRELAAENALLHQQILNSNCFKGRLDSDSAFAAGDSAFVVISAKVISAGIGKKKNFLLINKGRNDGVVPDMAVISPTGVAGIVVFSSSAYSTVMTLIHDEMNISARIKKNSHLGNIRWPGLNYRTGLLTDIPSHVYLTKGDTIITSGNSFIFPEGLLIGIVEQYYNDTGDKFNRADIRFATDFNNLSFVYVVSNRNREAELSTLNMKSDE